MGDGCAMHLLTSLHLCARCLLARRPDDAWQEAICNYSFKWAWSWHNFFIPLHLQAAMWAFTRHVCMYPISLAIAALRAAARSVSALFRLSGCYNIQMGPVRKSQRLIFCRQVSWQEGHRFCIQRHRAMTWRSTPLPPGGVSLDQWLHYVRLTTSWL